MKQLNYGLNLGGKQLGSLSSLKTGLQMGNDDRNNRERRKTHKTRTSFVNRVLHSRIWRYTAEGTETGQGDIIQAVKMAGIEISELVTFLLTSSATSLN